MKSDLAKVQDGAVVIDSPRPLIIPDMPAANYHAIEATSATVLKKLHESSPAHVKAGCAEESTEPMVLGSAFHCLTLEPEQFEARYWERPLLDMRRAKDKALCAELNETHRGKTAIGTHELADLKGAAGAIHAHPFVAPMLADSRKEVSLFWHEEDIGPCKCRLDMLAGKVIADLKSTRNAHKDFFRREICFSRHYWIQAAWYFRAARACGLDVSEFVFVAAEIKRPYGVTLHYMDEPELESLQERVWFLARTWSDAVRTGIYPAYPAVKHYVTIGGDDE